MSNSSPPTPKAIHNFDEAHAVRNRQLDSLMQAARDARRDYRGDITVAGVAHHIADDMKDDPAKAKAYAEILSCAIERLVDVADTATRQTVRCHCPTCTAHRART